MTVVSNSATNGGGSPAALASLHAAAPLLRLLGAISSIGSVRRVALGVGSTHADLWVMLADGALEDAHQIYLLEREFLEQVGEFPLDLHVVSLSEIDERKLPPAETLFAR